jgi:hypothetical protein
VATYLYLKTEMAKWYIHDVFKPLICSFLIFGALKIIQVNYVTNITLINFAGMFLIANGIYLMIIPETKALILAQIWKIK